MSKIQKGELDQYGAEPFKQQQFGTAGVKGVKPRLNSGMRYFSFFSQRTILQFLASASLYARYCYRSSVCLSVCLSVTMVIQLINRAKIDICKEEQDCFSVEGGPPVSVCT